MMPKHIKVELDFIPIEERMPDLDESKLVLEVLHRAATTSPINRDYAEYEGCEWLAVDGTGRIYNVSHWSPIKET